MEESATYQWIIEQGVEKGRSDGARQTILRQGRKRFGEPSASTLQKLESVASYEELLKLADRLLEVETRDELLS